MLLLHVAVHDVDVVHVHVHVCQDNFQLIPLWWSLPKAMQECCNTCSHACTFYFVHVNYLVFSSVSWWFSYPDCL